jgi:hypothetical protein
MNASTKSRITYQRHETDDDWARFITDSQNKDGQYLITLSKDVKSHPWKAHIAGNECLAVNGQPGGVIYIKRGKTYRISLMGMDKHKVIVTTDPIGGVKAAAFDGVEQLTKNKTAIINVGNELPSILYYQDTVDPMIGGLIVVERQRPKSHHSRSDTYRSESTQFN